MARANPVENQSPDKRVRPMTGRSAGDGRPRPALAALLVLGLAALAFGDEAARLLSLDEAVGQALGRNPAVLRARQEADAARGRRLQLQAAPAPELSFEAAALPLWNDKGGEEFSLGLRQLVEFPGKRGLRREIGRSGEAQAALELERVRSIVRGRVEKAYWQAVHARRQLDGLTSVMATLEEYSELAAARYKSGQVPYLDIVRGRVETLRLRNEIVEARRNLKERTAALELLMGERDYAPLDLSTDMGFTPVGKSLEELKAAALAGSSLRLAAERRRQAEHAAALARKAGLPDFTVGLFTPSKRLGGWGFEVGLTLPFFSTSARGAAVESEAMERQVAIAAEARRSGALFALESAYADARALEDEIVLFRDTMMREVEESLKAGLLNYQYGRADSLGVLDIVRGLKDARAEFLRALLNHQLALIDIATAGEDDGFGAASND
ncbi:MAG TPA: TolC family protein [Terriglobales bacterium]|nr:TolC family protein [Terriglobales bacterium]